MILIIDSIGPTPFSRGDGEQRDPFYSCTLLLLLLFLLLIEVLQMMTNLSSLTEEEQNQ